jgi:hypothetical protein
MLWPVLQQQPGGGMGKTVAVSDNKGIEGIFGIQEAFKFIFLNSVLSGLFMYLSASLVNTKFM